jgi:Sec-independent protein translocase protein TatA
MKLSHHRQAIVVFGIVAPAFLLIAVSVATFIGSSKLSTSFETKVQTLDRFRTAETQVKDLEAFLTTENRREKTAYWTSKLEKDVVESLTENLDKILAKYDSEVLRQTEMGQASGASGLGAKSKHPHSRMQLSFEGGYKPMQLLLAELETEMPHLILESLAVTPRPAVSESDKSTLQFRVVYLCWEKPKAPTAPQ